MRYNLRTVDSYCFILLAASIEYFHRFIFFKSTPVSILMYKQVFPRSTYFFFRSRLHKRFKRVNALIYNIIINTSKTATPQGIDKYHEIIMNNQHYEILIAKYYENNRNNLELVLAATRWCIFLMIRI